MVEEPKRLPELPPADVDVVLFRPPNDQPLVPPVVDEEEVLPKRLCPLLVFAFALPNKPPPCPPLVLVFAAPKMLPLCPPLVLVGCPLPN